MRALGASRTSVATGGILGANWARNPLWKNARAVPSLDLRFAENKSLTDAKTGASLVTFTRASTGTYVGSDGLIKTAVTNEARFDHNPTTGESLGLLVEEARTNLVLRSEELDNASWTKQSSVSVSANTTISPDGALTADTVTADQSLGIFQSVAATVSTTYTNSVYIKAGTATAIMLRDDTGAGRHIVFNPSTGVITATSGTLVSSGSQALNNGWYRYFMTYVADATTARGIIRPNSAGSAQTFIAWGAQIEAGAFATSYIPTTTATATRAADVASITGANFSSWYNQTEGTVFSDCLSTFSATQVLVNIAATAAITATSAISLSSNLTSSQKRVRVRDAASADQASLALGASSSGSRTRIAAAIKANDFAASLDGGTAVTDTSGTVPTVVLMEIGCTPTGVTLGTQLHRRLTYWPTRLADTTLQAITSP